MIPNMEDLPRLFTDDRAEKEKYMHTHQKWPWGKNTEYFFPWHSNNPVSLGSIISDFKPGSVLDYGCGQGLTLKKLSEQFPSIDFCNYDAFVDEYSAYPSVPCDLLVSNNALHHIEDEFYDQLVENLYSLCNKTALFKLYLFENFKSADWYIEKYSRLFNVDSVIIGETMETEPEKTDFVYGIRSHTKTPLYLRLSKQ